MHLLNTKINNFVRTSSCIFRSRYFHYDIPHTINAEGASYNAPTEEKFEEHSSRHDAGHIPTSSFQKVLPSVGDALGAILAPSRGEGVSYNAPTKENFEEFEEHLSRYNVPYTGHIPTSSFQKVLLSFGSSLVAISAPWRGDMVSTLGEATGVPALKMMHRKMLHHPVGQQILSERPRINGTTVDLEYLRTLPEGTFGREYSNFLTENGIHPDRRPPVQYVDDPDLAYVMTRYRETHDLLHTILGMPTHMLGEVVVKCVEALQTGLPMCVSGGLFGPLRLGPKHFQKYIKSHLWWAIRNGLEAQFLLNIYYEKHWEQPLDKLRTEMNLELPPPTPRLRRKSQGD